MNRSEKAENGFLVRVEEKEWLPITSLFRRKKWSKMRESGELGREMEEECLPNSI